MIARGALGVLLVLSCGLSIDALIIEGQNFYRNNTKWELLGKFCFDTSGGTLRITGENSEGYDDQEFAFYHDMPNGGFSEVYKAGSSCRTKVDKSARHLEISLPVFTPGGTGKVFNVTGSRPRWWYVIVANCAPKQESVSLASYSITFTNKGGKYSRHFSADEEGIFESLIFAILVLLVELGLLAVWFTRLRKQENQRVHYLLAVVMVCVAIDAFAVFLSLIHHDSFASDGVGMPDIPDVVLFLELFPEIILIGLFVWIAKGWMISEQLRRDGRSLLEVLFVYLVASVLLFYWNFHEDDQALVLSLWQSPPGYVMVVLRCLTGVWFVGSILETYRLEKAPSKQSFYTGFGVFGCLFFISLPILVIAASSTDTWTRRKVVTIMNHVIMYVTYFVFWFLFGFKSDYIKRVGDEREALTGGRGRYGRSSIDTGTFDGDEEEAQAMTSV